MAERKSKNNLAISGVSCIWMCKELICLLPSLPGASNPHQQLRLNSQSHGTKKHQGEPGFITGLWRGWERRNTSSSCPEVKKKHPRGSPAWFVLLSIPQCFFPWKEAPSTCLVWQKTPPRKAGAWFTLSPPPANHVGNERQLCFGKGISEGHFVAGAEVAACFRPSPHT